MLSLHAFLPQLAGGYVVDCSAAALDIDAQFRRNGWAADTSVNTAIDRQTDLWTLVVPRLFHRGYSLVQYPTTPRDERTTLSAHGYFVPKSRIHPLLVLYAFLIGWSLTLLALTTVAPSAPKTQG